MIYNILYWFSIFYMIFLSLITQLGSDSFAQEYLEILKKENVDVSHVKIQKDKHSGIAHIIVTEDGTFLSYIVLSLKALDSLRMS